MDFELVYTSVLAPTTDVLSLADIVRRGRSYNHANGLTGILVFDGERFCQHLEGEPGMVLLLAAKIAADPRHTQYTLVHQGFTGQQRRFGHLSLGYALDTQGIVVNAVRKVRGPLAATLLMQLMTALEIQTSS